MICFTASQLDDMARHLEAAYPHEGCGLLVGTRGKDGTIVSRLAPAPNARATDAATRFEVDPKFQFDLMRELEGTNEQIVGHFHSHPNGSAIPSERDKKMALDKEMVWIIVPVTDGKAGDPMAYAVAEEEKSFLSIRLIEV